MSSWRIAVLGTEAQSVDLMTSALRRQLSATNAWPDQPGFAWKVAALTSWRDASSEASPYQLVLLMGLSPSCSAVSDLSDQKIRQALTANSVPFAVVYGTPEERLKRALALVARFTQQSVCKGSTAIFADTAATTPPVEPMLESDALSNFANRPRSWVAMCDRCSDPQCELRLLTDRLA